MCIRDRLETAPQIERVGVAAVEFQKPRGAEKHRFDGMRGEPFAQHDFVGDLPGQPQEGFLILTVAQRAEIEQVESPVSYTHLDVYKRQQMQSRATSSPMPDVAPTMTIRFMAV